jgi:uncharacterized protein
MTEKIGRNDPCKCGSGKKYKNCCMDKDQPKPSASLGLKGRKITAKVLNVKQEEKVGEQPNTQERIMPVDYNVLMQRSFGENLRTYTEKPPLPEDPSEYLATEDREEGDTEGMN